jgi:hypothetical protein
MQQPSARPLATVRDYGELIEALRARCDELDVAGITLDDVAGLPTGLWPAARRARARAGGHRGSPGAMPTRMGLRASRQEGPTTFRAWVGGGGTFARG